MTLKVSPKVSYPTPISYDWLVAPDQVILSHSPEVATSRQHLTLLPYTSNACCDVIITSCLTVNRAGRAIFSPPLYKDVSLIFRFLGLGLGLGLGFRIRVIFGHPCTAVGKKWRAPDDDLTRHQSVTVTSSGQVFR